MASLTLPWLLENATYSLMFLLLLAAGLGVPIPEDIILIAGGALVHRGATHLVPTLVVCAVGVLAGDTAIFLFARRLGHHALERPFFRRLLPEPRRLRLERLFDRWGGGIIFAARHVAGLRAPVFALAGVHRMRLPVFLLWDAAGLCVSGPLFIGLGYLFSDNLDDALNHVARLQHFVVFGIAALVAATALYASLRWMFDWRRRRRAVLTVPRQP